MASGKNEKEWLVLRHLEHEHIGTIASVLEERGESYRYFDLYQGAAVPQDPNPYRGVIVMGGSMGVYDSAKYPFLAHEQSVIRKAAELGLPVLGICLGSQLIAAAFGASVYPGPQKEIGWYAIEKTSASDSWTASLPSRFMGFHWHGDTFDLPTGATRLFRSDLYENQGFRIGSNVLALQFHFEVDEKMIGEWLNDEACKQEIATVPGISAETIREETKKWTLTLEQRSKYLFRNFLGSCS